MFLKEKKNNNKKVHYIHPYNCFQPPHYIYPLILKIKNQNYLNSFILTKTILKKLMWTNQLITKHTIKTHKFEQKIIMSFFSSKQEFKNQNGRKC